jgi:hypothetical protein
MIMIDRKAFIYLIITLMIGFALGAFSDGLHHLHRSRKDPRMQPRFFIGDMLAKDLSLSESQMEQLEGIFKVYEERFQQRREDIRKQVEEDLDSLSEELRPFLTGEQIKRLDEWIEGGMPPGPGPQPGAPGREMVPPPPGQHPRPPARDF